MVDLGRYRCKGYNSVIIGHSKVILHEEREDDPFNHLSIVFLFYKALQYQSNLSLNSLIFYISGVISSSPADFLFLIFLSTKSSSPCVNSHRLMSS